MEQQSKNFERILNHLVANLPQNTAQPMVSQILTLPVFDPEAEGTDPRAWLNTVDMCLHDHPREGSNLVLSLSSAFKGTAAGWLLQNTYPDIKWADFKKLFLTEFDSVDTPASIIASQLALTPSDSTNYVGFASKMLGILTPRFSQMNSQEMAFSLVLPHLSTFYGRITRIVHNNEVAW